jgi:SAM-dependent methyltransferase
MDTTLAFYNSMAADFVQGTIHADVESLRQSFLKYLPQGAAILDLGCGSGRDSKHFIEKGYSVTAVDGSAELCKLASAFIGREVIQITFDRLDYHQIFDGVWACASLLHVPSQQLPSIFGRISRSLKPGGYLYVSFKYGSFEGERNGRYFTDLTEDRLAGMISDHEELEIIEMAISNDVREDRQDEKWINAIIRKRLED